MSVNQVISDLDLNNAKTEDYYSLEQLLELARQASVELPRPPGSITLLYSGPIGDLSSTDIAELLGENSNGLVRTIGQTDAGTLLSSRAFFKALTKALGGDERAANEILYGARGSDGNRITTGLFDEASIRFVQETGGGDFVSLTQNARGDRVFAQSELPTLLADERVGSIQGIPRDQIIGFRDLLTRSGTSEAEAFDAVLDLVTLKSRLDSADVRIGLDSTGQINWADPASLRGALAGSIPDGVVSTSALGEVAGPFTETQRAAVENLSRLYDQVSDAARSQQYAEVLGGVGKALTVVGSAFLIASFIDTAFKANDAYEAGRPDLAQGIIKDWVAKTEGALLAGSLAFESTAALLAPLALLGPIGIGAAVVGTLGASLLAGFLGSEAAKWLVDNVSIANLFTGAQAILPIRRDPLALDLDGDGLETIGLNGRSDGSSVLFDHDGDGIKTGSGWLKGDFGWLVLDRNGNGTIDSGNELFGEERKSGSD